MKMHQLELNVKRSFLYPDGSMSGRKNILKMTGLPEEAMHIEYELTDELQEVFRWSVLNLSGKNHTGRGLILAGDFGTGKTTAALLAAMTFYNAGKSIHYMRMRLFVKLFSERIALSNSWKTPDDPAYDQWYELNERMNRMTGLGGLLEPYDLLVLDDVGKENNTKHTKDELDDIVRSRREARKPTIITTNLDIDDLDSIDERYVEGFGSFLAGNFDLLDFYGPDRRLED